MTGIRTATEDDLDFLVEADRRADGDPPDPSFDGAAHRDKIARFIRDADRAAWVHEVDDDSGTRREVAMLLARFRDPAREATG